MNKKHDLTGKTFNYLNVLSFAYTKGIPKSSYWNCLCVCGNTKIIAARHLKNNSIIACGCKRYLNLQNKKIGKLLVLDKSHYENENVFWNSLCDCGNKTIVKASSLQSGHTQSCGCLQRIISSAYNKNYRQKYRENEIGKIYNNCKIISINILKPNSAARVKVLCHCKKEFETALTSLKRSLTTSCGCNRKLEYGVASFNNLYFAYKAGASRRKYLFKLTKEYFQFLTKQNCYYCNLPPSQIVKSKCNTGDYVYNGIDRVDNSKGYISENCVTCCKKCNSTKQSVSIEMARKMLKFLEGKQNV